MRGIGILPDPDATVVFDGGGRLIAKSKADALTVVCNDTPHACHGFDHYRSEMLRLQPAGDADGPVLPPLAETDREVIGPFGPGAQS